MNSIFNFSSERIINFFDQILIAFVGALVSTLIGAFLLAIKKRFSPKSLPEPEEQAIYLNMPEKFLDDNCIGRDKLLEKVFNKITDDKKNLFKRKCIAITGEEGIGKSLFCYTLFQYYLRKSPVYLGWIECNGKQSVFDIIRDTFDDSRFHRKDKNTILKNFISMNKACILFVDQINQFAPINELEEISHCPYIILILSGTLRKINFVDCSFELLPLSEKTVRTIFEQQTDEEIGLMDYKSRKSVECLLEVYSKGNPSLVKVFSKAKPHYKNKWENVLNGIQVREYDDDNYLKIVLRQLYRISELSNEQKSALSKLSIIHNEDFTKSVFELLEIPDDCVESLCKTYWLVQKDNITYSMDKIHRDIIKKTFIFEINLENAIDSINIVLQSWNKNESNTFKWISLYIENILKIVQGYATHIIEKEFFSEFAYYVAVKYDDIKDSENCLRWIELCKPKDTILLYKKTRQEFQVKYPLVNIHFSFSEIEHVYLDALEKVNVIEDVENEKRFLMREYCNFLCYSKHFDDALILCKEYFEIYSMDFSDIRNCEMYDLYLSIANKLDNMEILKHLVNETIIQSLYQNERVSIANAWSFGELGRIYMKWGDKKTSDMYMRHMVVLLNEQRRFYDENIKLYLKITEEEFAEYMHSCGELLNSLNQALNRKDVDALYIEGRYQEKHGNLDAAFKLYEEAASKDSLRGRCSLAVLYYRGQREARDYDKARRYWEYCCERGHKGSYYWLGILLLDTDYDGYDKELALQYLAKADELGSEHAKQKLIEIQNYI